jgi:1-acyl-sn-glycerol-3-phosphate acyltransferase
VCARTAPAPLVLRSRGEVVDDDGLIVRREVHAEGDRVGAQRERPLERGDRVLGRVRGGAAVGDDERRRRRAPLATSPPPWHYRGVHTPVLDVVRPAVWLSARLYFGIRFEGVANIPKHGPLLITPNHVTFADPPLVSIPIRRPVHYMAWDRLFDIRGLSWLIRRLRAFPVDIESADPKATRAAVRLLDAGQIVMIFPEAGRSLDGRLQRFKLGAFRLACARGVPVLPVTILGGHECLAARPCPATARPPHHHLPSRRRAARGQRRSAPRGPPARQLRCGRRSPRACPRTSSRLPPPTGVAERA